MEQGTIVDAAEFVVPEKPGLTDNDIVAVACLRTAASEALFWVLSEEAQEECQKEEQIQE